MLFKSLLHIPSVKRVIWPNIQMMFAKAPLKFPIHFPFYCLQILFWRLRDFTSELHFDFRRGITTSILIQVKELMCNDRQIKKSVIGEYGNRYRPAYAWRVQYFLNKLAAIHNVQENQVALVDYGCGAGRILFLAHEAGFYPVAGVELSPTLVELAQHNLKNYLHKFSRRPEYIKAQDVKEQTKPKIQTSQTSSHECILIHHANAAEFEIPDTAGVLFFFDPFAEKIFDLVFQRVNESLNRNPRTLHVLDKWCKVDFQKYGFTLLEERYTIKLWQKIRT